MKKKMVLAGLLLSSPAWCDLFGISDAIYWAQQIGLMRQQIQQVTGLYEEAMQYKQMFQNAAAFVHNPAMFLAQTAAISQMAIQTANATGITTPQRAAQLQEIVRLQQVAMREAQTIGTITHSNMASIGTLSNDLQASSMALAGVRQELLDEQRADYYRQHNTYQPQSDIIAAWRMK